MEKTLHYIYDPLCGWCYAAESLADAAVRRAPGLFEIKLHAGGLFARTQLTEAKRNHIRSSDARIAQMTGQVFEPAYLDGLLSDPDTIYDSVPPILGILAANAVQPGSDLKMLKALQRGHYRSGLRVVEFPTIISLAESIGLDATAFSEALTKTTEVDLMSHLEATHKMMYKVGANGYPTFVAQIGDRFSVLPHDSYYGKAEAFGELLATAFA